MATKSTSALARLQELVAPGVPPQHLFAFYLGIPLALAYLFGLNHVGMARLFPNYLSLLYWAGIMVPYWLTLEMASRFAALVLRPWKLPLWSILLAGAILALLIMGPYVKWHSGVYRAFLPPDVTYTVPPTLPSVVSNWSRIIDFSPIPLLWIAANYFYDRLIDIPRFRGRLMVVDAAEDQPAESAEELEADRQELLNAGFALSLPERIGRHVVALQAEDHYIRVFTRRGSALVRYRFRDAVKELEHIDGLRVHRSFWVRKDAVETVEADSRSCMLILANGVKIPVSRSYREAARLAGLLVDG